MKKILIFVAMMATLLLAGCKSTSEFNRALNEDYEAVMAEYPEALLYEVQTQFNDNFTTMDSKGLHVVTAREVFQVKDTLVMFIDRNFDEGTRVTSLENGAWLEDVKFGVKELKDVNEALDAMFKSDIIVPDSNLMTLRKPLGPTIYAFPFYIFGGSKEGKYVAVDAHTLEVQEFE